MQYKKNIIAFIDILGTKSLIHRTKHDKKLTGKIYQVIKVIVGNLKSQQTQINKRENIKYQFTHFSDSFVISIEISEKLSDCFTQVAFLYYSLRIIVDEFIRMGIVVRGGITTGDIIHTKTHLFGPGIIEAYELESTVAKYPRIIFSSAFMDELSEVRQIGSMMLGIKQDSDSIYYFNYFEWGIKNFPDVFIDYFYDLVTCLKNIGNKEPGLTAKYNWLKFKLTESLNGFDVEKFKQFVDRNIYDLPYTDLNKQKLKELAEMIPGELKML